MLVVVVFSFCSWRAWKPTLNCNKCLIPNFLHLICLLLFKIPCSSFSVVFKYSFLWILSHFDCNMRSVWFITTKINLLTHRGWTSSWGKRRTKQCYVTLVANWIRSYSWVMLTRNGSSYCKAEWDSRCCLTSLSLKESPRSSWESSCSLLMCLPPHRQGSPHCRRDQLHPI